MVLQLLYNENTLFYYASNRRLIWNTARNECNNELYNDIMVNSFDLCHEKQC